MQFGEKSWPEARDLSEKVVVVPLGSCEQHGHHLPLLTDSLIGEEIVRRAEAQVGNEVLFLPMLWLGSSDHHLAFAGTVSVSAETYISMLADILDSLVGSGYRRIFLLNSHAGNTLPASLAIQKIQLKYSKTHPNLWLVFANWFGLAAPQIALIDGLKQTKISHACEWETSQVLSCRPDLVGDERPSTRFDNGSAFYCADYSIPGRVEVARAIEQVSQTGAFGFPELASAEKGEALFQVVVNEVVAFVREFATWQTISDTDTNLR